MKQRLVWQGKLTTTRWRQTMRIVCLGGGPAGLYFSILMKKTNPECSIRVLERNPPDSTFGWGVVLSDQTMQGFREDDAPLAEEIERNFHHWDNVDVFFRDQRITSGGHGFCAIGRLRLIQILQARARALGVDIEHGVEFADPDDYSRDYDLVIGSDGVHSVTRNKYAEHFNPHIEARACRFIWLGVEKKLDAFTFAFKETPWGWFNLHSYQFSDAWSTVIVETPEEVWQKAGIDQMTPEESIVFCEQLFADRLGGARLVSNAGHLRGAAGWLKFNHVLCQRWYKDNLVLIGDAAHTAHFSIGSGTRLAMEDAAALVKVLNSSQGGVPSRLERYQAEREAEALKLQSAAHNRMSWFENIRRYASMAPEQFAFTLLTGSQRIGHDKQKQRDPAYIAHYDRWFAERCGVSVAAGGEPPLPLLTPFKLRDLCLVNRLIVSPTRTDAAVDGVPADFHLVHYGARAQAGAALVIVEMTAVSPEARRTPGGPGLWNDQQTAGWRRLVDFTHRHTAAGIGLQIGHAGLPEPEALTPADMAAIKAAFVAAVRRAAEAGFDLVECHAAHGDLLASFISPLSNRRTDDYGGSFDNRCRFPLEVLAAMRHAWPPEKPLSVRLSVHDKAPGNAPPDEAIEFARRCQAAGVDIIHVSSGQGEGEQPMQGSAAQTLFADQIRNELNIPTIAVSKVFDADDVNTIIAAGRADLCAVPRASLSDPA
ncbi:MAG: FAD-dependent monooxygenase [Azonexus sp.]|nr:FAD-dependent monooxygenase [Azonexus sp.]